MNSSAPTHPLLVRFGAMGDMILLTPIMRALWQRDGCSTTVAALGGLAPRIFKHLPFVNDVVSISSCKTPYWFSSEQRRLVGRIRGDGCSPILNFQSDGKSQRLVKRAGLPIAGSACTEPRRSAEHVVDHYARLAGLDLSTSGRGCELAVSADEQRDVSEWLKKIGCDSGPLVLVQPGSRRQMLGKSSRLTKSWPNERWLAVIREVRREIPDARILIIGAPIEQELGDELARAANDERVRAVAAELPLRRLFALLDRAHSLISVDTGPAHAAAALECPLVVLFGKADPRVIRPLSRSSPVHVVTGKPIDGVGAQSWRDYHSIEDITAEQVMTAWKNFK